MKYSQVTIPCSKSLRFFALLIISCTILVHICATESLKNDDEHETRREFSRLIHERRAVKENGTTNQKDIEKRLKILENRYVLPMQFSDNIIEKKNTYRAYFRRKERAEMTEEACHTHLGTPSYLLEFCIFCWSFPWPFFNFNAFHGSHQRKASYNFKALDGKEKNVHGNCREAATILVNSTFWQYLFVDSQGSEFYQPPKKMKFAIFSETLYSIFLCKQKEI